jgi:asparagine synthase (glutamine-hydrolysing)
MVVVLIAKTRIYLERKDVAEGISLNLKQVLYDTVSETVPETKAAVAFSGGVDSSLLTKICIDLGKEIILVTVGFPDSHDIGFSKDIALKMGVQQKIATICEKDFQENLQRIRQSILCKNTSHIENCIAYLYIAKLANQNGIDLILSANGFDELFCGYNAYRMVYNDGAAAIMKFMDEKIANEMSLVEEIAKVSKYFSVSVKQPFLSEKFIKFAKMIPIDQKIKGSDDMIRKHILRQVALSVDVPIESAMKAKKALQYGSSIHKYLKKSNQ